MSATGLTILLSAFFVAAAVFGWALCKAASNEPPEFPKSDDSQFEP